MIRTLDLFSGGGGSSWGAQRAGAEIVCGVDAWPLANQAFQKNFPGARSVNLRLTPDSRPSELGDIGEIDLLLASPECTNHSCARGSRPRDEASRDTAKYVINFAEELNPRWIIIENVINMKSWGGYRPLLANLHRLKYEFLEAVLDANDFCVAQNRRRMFLVCQKHRRPSEILPRLTDAYHCAEDVIARPGNWESRPLYQAGRAPATIERAERAMAELGRRVPFLIVYYGSDASGGWQRLDRPLRTITTIDRFGLVTWEGRTPMLRMLQVPELQRAMGFKGRYTLNGIGQRRDRIKLLGNGVSPPVMTAVVKSLISPAAATIRSQKELVLEAV